MGRHDEAIDRRAARRQDLLTTAELNGLGLGSDAIARRVRNGRLHRVHRGVYKWGTPRMTQDQRHLAATLAAGPGTVLSADSGLLHLGLDNRAPPKIHVTVPRAWAPRLDGVVVHQAPNLHPRDAAVHRGVPCTTVPRTLLDVAGTRDVAALARLFHEAHVRFRTTPAMVEASIARTPNRAGIGDLRAAMGTDHRLTLSALEDGFLVLLRSGDRELPLTNIDVAGNKVDCYWPTIDLVVELLSFRYHATRKAFEDDVARRRRSTHRAFTWGDVFERGASTLAQLDAYGVPAMPQ